MSQQPTIKWLTQKILYLIVFWVVAGAVLLYVAGYRVNWQTGRVNPSSSISLMTYQRSKMAVRYALNGENRSGQLPLILNWLPPGKYTVEVSADGYRTWHRSFTLAAAAAANFDNILLVSESVAARPATADERATLARVSQLVSDDLLVRGNELLDTSGETPRLIVRFSQPIEQAVWYPRRTHVVVRVGQQVSLLETTGTNQTELFTLTTTRPVKLAVVAAGATILVDEPAGALAYKLF